ncbi:hypothetical protein Dalk_5249 [Desulfatibacillum aliphaticivorans]|uniref:Uncharacterized protein n=1 Tax=Desulfatibacillum aliphaticivorans TaxID=218208 RepID=B8FED8_DESAL|nr:hypothetical protein Dalk_5249 [Desulfatibacillum aliphaticivorans]
MLIILVGFFTKDKPNMKTGNSFAEKRDQIKKGRSEWDQPFINLWWAILGLNQ